MQLETGADVDRGADRAVDGAVEHVRVEGALDLVARRVGGDAEPVRDMDPLDHENVVLELDLADRLACQPALARIDTTRLQRAPEGAGQSAARGGDDVVECRGVLGLAAPLDAVVVSHLVMHAEEDRFRLGGELGPPPNRSTIGAAPRPTTQQRAWRKRLILSR